MAVRYTELLMLLGEQVHDKTRVKSIATDCGLPVAALNLSGAPRDWWYEVLLAAHQRQRLEVLLDALRRELPHYAGQIVDPYECTPPPTGPGPAPGGPFAAGIAHAASRGAAGGPGPRGAGGEGHLAWHAPSVPFARRSFIAAGASAALLLAGVVSAPTLFERHRAGDGDRVLRDVGRTLGADEARPTAKGGAGEVRGFLSRPDDCGRLVINEVKTSGRVSALDEFVELFNAGDCAVVLDHWSLRYQAASGVGGYHYWKPSSTGLRVAPGKYFVIAGRDYAGPARDDEAVPNKGVAEQGGLALFRHDACVDSVAWGAVPAGHGHVETKAATTPRKGWSIARASDGVDTDSNADDFGPAAPTPGSSNRARPLPPSRRTNATPGAGLESASARGAERVSR